MQPRDATPSTPRSAAGFVVSIALAAFTVWIVAFAWEFGPLLPERNVARLVVTAPAADQCSSTPQGSSTCGRPVPVSARGMP